MAEVLYSIHHRILKIEDEPGAKSLQIMDGKVEFDDVCFSYSPG